MADPSRGRIALPLQGEAALAACHLDASKVEDQKICTMV